MAQTAAQIVTLACQDARCPGYTAQAGQLLNEILAELCEDHDLELAKATQLFTFNPSLLAQIGPNLYGGGPYPLPADYLRAAGDKPLTYWISGVPYMPMRIDMDQFDQQVQVAGNQSYPTLFTTDLSLYDEALQGLTVPMLYLYQPPSGAFAAQIRYHRQMPDIVTPETSAVAPWFPSTAYLRTKLTAKLMSLTGDSRKESRDAEAEGILSKYLIMKDDPEGRAKTVKLDRRTFGPGNSGRLKPTKATGW